MGIFSFLNRDQDYIFPEPEPVPEEPGVELPNLGVDMSIEILDEAGHVMNTGLVVSCKGRDLTVGRKPGALSFKISEPESTVFIRGCDNKMTQFYLRAKVVESTRTLLKVTDLEPELHDNHRSNFRLAVNAPISIYYMNDERMERPEKCILVDISTEGCCIQTDYLHGEGEVLRLKVKLEDYMAMDFVGEVIRVNDCGPNGFRCGILFAQLKKEETSALTKTLFNIQLGNRREHSRGEDGHW